MESIAEEMRVENIEHIDLTLPGTTQSAIQYFSDELVIMGAPVYGGRLPADAIYRFKQLRAKKNLVVLVVLYGNRDFEDALLELKTLTIELGFIPIAGGAFIGEHSFASKDVPIANGRPDALDVKIAREFGEKIKDKTAALKSPNDQADLKVPGRFPYEASGARSMAISPVTNEEICTVCGTCASICPTAAISVKDSVTTEIEHCLRCCTCIKNCPTAARQFEDGMMKHIATGLSQYCSYPKEPRIFGVDI